MMDDRAMTERSAPPAVCICVPTFRRPDGLRKLLAYIAQLNYAGAITVVVVDNDAETRGGAAVVAQLARVFPFPLACYLEPRRGHTYAYDQAFARACRAEPAPDYVAVLDDDEYPDREWLNELIKVALQYDADIVGGPVFPVFEAPDHWLAKSGLFTPKRFTTGPVPIIYGAGNMLIRRRTLERYLDEPLSHDFAFTGGGDEEFFWRCRRDGHTFAWADDAHAFETTPRSRTTVGYMLRRRFRAGTGATRVERKFFGAVAGAPWRWIKALALLFLGVFLLPFAALRGRPAVVRTLLMAARGSGRIAAEFGILYEEYR